jgi:hypothetical protein
MMNRRDGGNVHQDGRMLRVSESAGAAQASVAARMDISDAEIHVVLAGQISASRAMDRFCR